MIWKMNPKALLAGLSALLTLAASQAFGQQNCVQPGDILEVRTPGFLAKDTPNLIIEFVVSGSTLPVSTISATASRLRIQVPSVGLLSDERFFVYHIEANGQTRVVANLRTCQFTPAGPGVPGGQDDAGDDLTGGLGSPPVLQPATRFEVAAPSGAPEFILMGEAQQVSRAEAVVIASGGSILRRQGLPGLGLGMAIVDPQGGFDLSGLRSELAQRNIEVAAGTHQVYGLSQGDENAFARELVLGSASADCRLSRPVRVGLIDGPVDTDHPALRSIRIEAFSVLGSRDRPASSDHATGIVGLIASEEFGLAKGVQVFAVTAVVRAGTRELAKLESIAAGIDHLVSRNVDVINMSLAGPSNPALALAISEAAQRGIIMVASVGNDPRAPVAYPASDPSVIGVTAVDADKKLYRKASRGDGVDFAAPGVDLRVPSGRNGSAFRSGTSYASAALTALIAIELSKNGGSLDSILRTLSERAEDLGNVGPDAEFGFGMAQSSGC